MAYSDKDPNCWISEYPPKAFNSSAFAFLDNRFSVLYSLACQVMTFGALSLGRIPCFAAGENAV